MSAEARRRTNVFQMSLQDPSSITRSGKLKFSILSVHNLKIAAGTLFRVWRKEINTGRYNDSMCDSDDLGRDGED